MCLCKTMLAAAAVLEAPMSVWWAIQLAASTFPHDQAKTRSHYIVHYLGAQKELDLWPCFLTLLSLLPAQDLHIIFISPDMPEALNGYCCTFSSPSGQTCSIAAGCTTAAAGNTTAPIDGPRAAPGCATAAGDHITAAVDNTTPTQQVSAIMLPEASEEERIQQLGANPFSSVVKALAADDPQAAAHDPQAAAHDPQAAVEASQGLLTNPEANQGLPITAKSNQVLATTAESNQLLATTTEATQVLSSMAEASKPEQAVDPADKTHRASHQADTARSAVHDAGNAEAASLQPDKAQSASARADNAHSSSDQAANSTQAKACSTLCHQQQVQKHQGPASDRAGEAAFVSRAQRSVEAVHQLQLTFCGGLYHDVAQQLTDEHGSANLVFGANAGLAAYPSWVPTLQLLTQADAPPAIFTDFCEEAAFQAMCVMKAVAERDMQWLKVSVNPFRSPLGCQSKDNNLPSYSNAFVFGMAPK